MFYHREVKTDSVRSRYLGQVKNLLDVNPGKDVLLYAPGYQQSAAQAITSATRGRARVVRSCADLRNAIIAQGGP